MKRKAMNLLIIGLLVLSIVMLSVCIQKKEAAINGKWQEVGGTETVEFFKGGTVTFVENGMKVSVSKDELILTFPDGDVCKYQRVKRA